MRVFSASNSLFKHVLELKSTGKSIGFVPTMGALHAGHISLVKRAREDNDVVIVSIFVNPLQFNSSVDLVKYPRLIEADKLMLEEAKIDILFAPTEGEMYPSKPTISINFGKMASVMEGKFRKNHFEGVGIVVSKLLHSTMPDRAYFGMKDLQQFLLIKKMCEDLGFPIDIVGVETVREDSGLALSSRNLQLSENGRSIASTISVGLENIRKRIYDGQNVEKIKEEVQTFYSTVPELEIEYFEFVNPRDLSIVQSYDDLNELAVCIAGYVEGIRLIDNLYLRLK
jgi:pantoate--beta-alanine ligase